MNVQQLIDVLSKIEDKTLEIVFYYDDRADGGPIHCVDLEPAFGPYPARIVLREDTIENYHLSNPNYGSLTEEQYYEQLIQEKTEITNRLFKEGSYSNYYLGSKDNLRLVSEADLPQLAKDAADREFKYWLSLKENTSDHVNLYLEDSE